MVDFLWTLMAQQEEVAIQVLTVRGWYRGFLLLPAGGRVVDYLRGKTGMIGLTGVTDPAGDHHASVCINTEHVLAVRLQTAE